MLQFNNTNINNYLAKPKSKNLRSIVEEDILCLYTELFYDSLEKILVENESSFMFQYKTKALEIVKTVVPAEVWDEETFQWIIESVENHAYNSLYKETYAFLLEGYNAFLSVNLPKFLVSFNQHCDKNVHALHKCADKAYFIPITEDDRIAYVICSRCHMCYTAKMIEMVCEGCCVPFWSAYVPQIEKLMPPATWEVYHCDVILNEQMKCIKCDDLFWLKGDDLYCRNCKFMISPLDVAWRCFRCNKEFKARAKAYNPIEHQLIKLATKQALINKDIVKPRDLHCNCYDNIMDIKYVHNDYCDGRLYLGDLDGKYIVVCSKCYTFSSLNKYEWHCPKCKLSFHAKDIAITVEDDMNSNQKKTKHTLAISLGQSEDINEEEESVKEKAKKEASNEKCKEKPKGFYRIDQEEEELKMQKDKDKKKEYTIRYGNENSGHAENRFMVRPKKEETLAKKFNDQTEIHHIIDPITQMQIATIPVKPSLDVPQSNTVISTSDVDSYKKISFTMEELTLLSRDNEILSHVLLNDNEYSLFTLPSSDQLLKLLKGFKPISNVLLIYGYNQHEEEINVLTEKIELTLPRDIHNRASKPKEELIKEDELMQLLTHNIKPMSEYQSSLSPDHFVNTISGGQAKWKFSPLGTEAKTDQFILLNDNTAVSSLALCIIYAASLNMKNVDECITIVDKNNKDELIKFILSLLRGKYSPYFCELLLKLLDTEKKITFKQLEEMLQE